MFTDYVYESFGGIHKKMFIVITCETRDNGMREDKDFMTIGKMFFVFLTRHVLLNYL